MSLASYLRRLTLLLLLAACFPAPAYAQAIPEDPTEEPAPPPPGDQDCPTGVVVAGKPITADCDGVLVSPGDGWMLLDGWPVQYGRLRRERDDLTREIEQARRDLAAAEEARKADQRRARETTALVLTGFLTGALTAVGVSWATRPVGE